MIILNKEQIAILGKPNFACTGIARRLHELELYNVEKKSEDEQAAAIHFMLALYEKHGDDWRVEANKILQKRKE